ncbi:MAG: type II CRISPR-associated endonuclease Cas1 [Tagaea sp.]
MAGFRVIEIAEAGRHLSAERGFLVVSDREREIGRAPLEDILAVVATGHGLTYTNALLVRLCELGAALVICAPNFRPVGWVWPMAGHHLQAGRMRVQSNASEPLKKRVWQVLVRAKIQRQQATLEAEGKPAGGFGLLARSVRSGDPENIEAQAARRYWPLLMGPEFRRDTEGGGTNALLNYGYAVLRAATARAVAGGGLHPSLGVHHANAENAFCLVDDLMEPFRPVVDRIAAGLVAEGTASLTPAAKAKLAGVVATDLLTEAGRTPVATCIERLVSSLVRAFESGDAELALPLPGWPRIGDGGDPDDAC